MAGYGAYGMLGHIKSYMGVIEFKQQIYAHFRVNVYTA